MDQITFYDPADLERLDEPLRDGPEMDETPLGQLFTAWNANQRRTREAYYARLREVEIHDNVSASALRRTYGH